MTGTNPITIDLKAVVCMAQLLKYLPHKHDNLSLKGRYSVALMHPSAAGAGRHVPWQLLAGHHGCLVSSKLVREKTWVGREIGRIWEECGRGKNMIKIFCMTLI